MTPNIPFDPRDWISPPYLKCPRCPGNEFGVYHIGKREYSRRCRSCSLIRHSPLPRLTKKVILLDQFVCSNLVYSLRSDLLPPSRTPRPEYRELFELLSRLVALHIVVCPSSPTYFDESIVSRIYSPLKRLGEHLGVGSAFHLASEIERFQLVRHFMNWLDGRGDVEPRLSVREYADDELHSWREDPQVTVTFDTPQEDITALRVARDRLHEQMTATFARWKQHPIPFEQRVDEELASYGPATFHEMEKFRDAWQEVERGERTLDSVSVFPPPASMLLVSMGVAARDRGVPDGVIDDRIREYFATAPLRRVPYLRISTMLFASLAGKASSGQRALKSRGMASDVRMVASTLPYIDAALVDNELCGHLRELRPKLGFSAAVYSMRTVDDFLEYLRALLETAPASHIELVRSIYGDGALQPFWTLLQENDASPP